MAETERHSSNDRERAHARWPRLVARVGPVVVILTAARFSISHAWLRRPASCLELDQPVAAIRSALRDNRAARVAELEAVLANSWEPTRDTAQPWLLAPLRSAAVKASGVNVRREPARARDRGQHAVMRHAPMRSAPRWRRCWATTLPASCPGRSKPPASSRS